MRAYGVSVETVDEALTAIARPHVASVQIILNILRRKPLEQVLPAAQEAGVGIIARVPLASGLLTGKYDEHTTFAADDHRTLQPLGRGVRRRRDLLGRALRRRGGRRPRGGGAHARRRHHGPARAALGRRPAGSQHGDPGRPLARAGAGQRRRRRSSPPLDDATLEQLRRLYDDRVRAAGARPLVSRPPPRSPAPGASWHGHRALLGLTAAGRQALTLLGEDQARDALGLAVLDPHERAAQREVGDLDHAAGAPAAARPRATRRRRAPPCPDADAAGGVEVEGGEQARQPRCCGCVR